MLAEDRAEAKPRRRRGGRLARAFWILGCADVLVCLLWLMQVENSPGGEFSGYIVFLLLVLLALVGVVMAIVALVRRPTAYAIGLALLVVPPVWWSLMRFQDLVDSLSQVGD
jgi:O-antigen ligase